MEENPAVPGSKPPESDKEAWAIKTRIALSLILAVIIAGCTEKYGQPMAGELPRITIMRALTDHSLINQGVTVEGIILSQCQASGCWFFLKDDTGRILIDLAPSNFTIPLKRMGKRARVDGILSEREGEIIIIGKEVNIY